jgi:hypothetical protein
MVTGESAKETVKTTVQGKPDASGDLWLLTRVLFDAHAAAGPSDTRLSLRPLSFEGQTSGKPRTHGAARMCGHAWLPKMLIGINERVCGRRHHHFLKD